MNGLARKGDSIKWAKGDPYPSKSRRRSCSPSGASFENGKDDSPKTGCIGSFSFSLLFFFLSYRRLHDNERSKGPVERGQFREIVAGRLRSRASSRNREKLCVTTRYFFLQGVYVYIYIYRLMSVSLRYRRPLFQTLSTASFQVKYFCTEFGMRYSSFSKNLA